MKSNIRRRLATQIQNYPLKRGNSRPTEEIVQLSLDRYGVEKQFRSSKSGDHVRVNPFYHWTDSKIRCQLLSCVIALTVLRVLELKVNEATNRDEPVSGRQILEGLSQLHSSWLWYAGSRQPVRARSTLPPTLKPKSYRPSAGWSATVGSYSALANNAPVLNALRLLCGSIP